MEEAPETTIREVPENSTIPEHHLTQEEGDERYLVVEHPHAPVPENVELPDQLPEVVETPKEPEDPTRGIVKHDTHNVVEILKDQVGTAVQGRIETAKKRVGVLEDMSIDAQTRVNTGMDFIGDIPVLGTAIKKNPIVGAASVFNDFRKDMQNKDVPPSQVITNIGRNALDALTFGFGTKVLDTVTKPTKPKETPPNPEIPSDVPQETP